MSNQPYYAANIYGQPQHSQPVISKSSSAIKEGKILASPYDHGQTQVYPSPDTDIERSSNNWTKGEVQPKRFNDILFGLIFNLHLVTMIALGIKFIPSMYLDLNKNYPQNRYRYLVSSQSRSSSQPIFMIPVEISNFAFQMFRTLNERKLEDINDDSISNYYVQDNDTDLSELDINEVLFMIAIAGGVGFIVAGMALPLMISCARPLIKFALILNIFFTLLILSIGIVANVLILVIGGFSLFAILACYTYSVWDRIPFAASNLITAVTAVKQNLGLIFHAYISIIIIFGWTILWSLISASVLYAQGNCNGLNCQNEVNGFLVTALLVSLYWTHQVVKNIVHVTVAGTVGTWWFTPIEANSCCSKGVQDSWMRAVTYSFGSICLGSLLVAIIQAFKNILKSLKDESEGVLLCCADCLIDYIEKMAMYFNQWAFVFVAIYGYNFLEAGYNVINLFQSRGWVNIITDNLVESCLFVMSLGVGLITGIVAVIVGKTYQLHLGNMIPFFLGSVVGFALTSVLMGVVGSAINTVIVCYGEAPRELQKNHPTLSSQMRDSWRRTWPIDFNY